MQLHMFTVEMGTIFEEFEVTYLAGE